MKRLQAASILPLIVVSWISLSLHRDSHTIPEPQFTAFNELEKDIEICSQELAALKESTTQLKAKLDSLAVAIYQLNTEIPAVKTKPEPEPIIDTRQVSYARQVDFTPEPKAFLASDNQFTNAPTVEILSNDTFNPTPTSEEYWRRIQVIAETQIFGRKEKIKFLQDGSQLIQKLEEAEAGFQIDVESAEFLQTRIFDEGVSAVTAFFILRKDIAEQMSLISQYRRDIEALIDPYTKKKNPRLTISNNHTKSEREPRFSNLSADKKITITPDGQFLIRIHFFYRSMKAGIPTLTNITDTYNLNAMQSVSQNFFYPQDFTAAIYELVRQMWRNKAIEWDGEMNQTVLQNFLTVIRK